jgi:hypothetical protein
MLFFTLCNFIIELLGSLSINCLNCLLFLSLYYCVTPSKVYNVDSSIFYSVKSTLELSRLDHLHGIWSEKINCSCLVSLIHNDDPLSTVESMMMKSWVSSLNFITLTDLFCSLYFCSYKENFDKSFMFD